MNGVIEGRHELSGYLAGIHKPGHAVARLEEAWADKKVKHAIAFNSATSGLLAAGSGATPSLRFFSIKSSSIR